MLGGTVVLEPGREAGRKVRAIHDGQRREFLKEGEGLKRVKAEKG